MREEQLINTVYYVSLFTSLIPLALILFKGKKLQNKMYLWLAIYLSISVVNQLIKVAYIKNSTIGWGYYNAGMLLSFVFVALFYFNLLKTKSLKHLVLSKIPICLLVLIIEVIYKKDFNMYYEFTFITMHFFICVFAMYYFYEILNKNIEHDYLEDTGAFWINAAVLLLYGGTFIVALVFDIILRSIVNHAVYSSLIISILSIVANLLFSLGLTTRKIRLTE